MSSKVVVTPNFQREAKKLKKKYHSLKKELNELVESLEKDPLQGTLISENVYKIRLSVKSKGKGKSGGARVITYLHIEETEDKEQVVYLISIYDKLDYENISDNFIRQMIDQIETEIESSDEDSKE
jgi:mRNA-degrading endonuclease RelE of RelBE toxin-antitoxin system